MTDYENTILGNIMICGIHPDTIWSICLLLITLIIENLLTQELLNYKPDILFSYPESKEQQQGLLKVLFYFLSPIATNANEHKLADGAASGNWSGKVFIDQ